MQVAGATQELGTHTNGAPAEVLQQPDQQSDPVVQAHWCSPPTTMQAMLPQLMPHAPQLEAVSIDTGLPPQQRARALVLS